MISLSPLPPHTCSVSVSCPHLPPISLWVPEDFGFFPFIPKARDTSSHCCPPSCRGYSVPDLPAWFHPSLMASSWLCWPPAERGCQPTSQGRAPAVPHHHHHHLAASMELCPAVGIPTLDIVLCASQAGGRVGEGKGEVAGEAKRGRKGRGLHL